MDRSWETSLDTLPGGLAHRIAAHLRTHHPVTVAVAIAILGWVLLSALTVALGLLLTHVLLHGGVGRWDDSVDAWFVTQRTTMLNSITAVATTIGSTMIVVAVAAVAVALLAFRRLWQEIGLIVIALTVEVAVFLTATVMVNRPRPTVPHLDPAPPTSSFPSGHTAAAIALWISLAIVISRHVKSAVARTLVWIVAMALPIFVGLSRLYRGMHHPTDVFASVLVGVGAILIAGLAVGTASAVAAIRRPPEVEAAPRPSSVPLAS
jgi:membrane-associated phospholipid phosphatase